MKTPFEINLFGARLSAEQARRRVESVEIEMDMRSSTSLYRFSLYAQDSLDASLRQLAFLESLDTQEITDMPTKFPAIFEALAAPFSGAEVKILPKGKGIRYVTARTVMNRLDDVLGPENWFDEYTPQPSCVICRLTIRLPDGDTITKADAGGHAGMTDEGDDEKSGYSDAFKRAAVKFGVGRHLYGDGSAHFEPTPTTPTTPPTSDYHGPQTTKEFMAWVQAADPDGANGTRAALIEWGKTQAFPPKVGLWSDLQSRLGFRFLAAREAQAEARAGR